MGNSSGVYCVLSFILCVGPVLHDSATPAFAQAGTGSPHLRLPPGPFEQWSPFAFEIDWVSNSNAQNLDIDDATDIEVQITDPSGSQALFPAFRTASNSGHGCWQCRFTPREVGNYSARIHRRNSSDLSDKAVSFDVAASTNSRGFLRAEKGRPFFLTFDNHEQFRGLGTNIGWEPRRRRRIEHTYDALFPKIAANGMNTVRTWICPWNMPIEWDTRRLGEYDDDATRRLDEMFALAEKNELYVVLVLGYHGELQTESGAFPGNDRWKENPYNVANGGPCENPAAFFTNERAKSLYKKKLRYLVSRVACHPHLLAWEFWNEIDHIERRGPVPGHAIVAWHDEMADYLHALDPYDHPITTSVSVHAPPGLWEVKGLDLIMLHPYGITDGLATLLEKTNAKFGKPAIAGEFSYSWKSADRDEAEKFERELRLGLWRGLMSPTPILPMTWWWEFHDSRADWRHFRPVAEFSNRMTELNQPNWKAFQAVTAQDSIECRGIQIGNNWFLWVHNRGSEPIDSETPIAIPNASSGDYQLRQFSTLTGDVIAQSRISLNTVNGKLSVMLPPLDALHDTSLILDKYTSSE